jgi:hypothetical protein
MRVMPGGGRTDYRRRRFLLKRKKFHAGISEYIVRQAKFIQERRSCTLRRNESKSKSRVVTERTAKSGLSAGCPRASTAQAFGTSTL